jgi:hypothetical protein
MGGRTGKAPSEWHAVVFGSLWVMEHLNHNMVPMDQLMRMQR